jgi:hypothetical protein
LGLNLSGWWSKLRHAKRSSKDLNQTAFSIVQQSTGQAAPVPAKNPAAVALGRLGGLKGGKAFTRRSGEDCSKSR